MAKLLLIVCAIFACGLVPVYAQTTATNPTSPAVAPAPTNPGAATTPGEGPSPPPARLIKPRATTHTETHPVEHTSHQHPLDDRCRPLKDQLELALQKPGNQHRLFQARVAHNAGSRLCREGHAEKGIAEMQRGLSYLQETSH